MPLISVIIPAYNQGQYLGRAIQSVLHQTHRDLEAIVVDDGSTDNTREVGTEFSDSRVKYIYQENRGLSGARNTGLKNASGGLVAFLDADDLFVPDALTLLAYELKKNHQLGLVAGQSVRIDESGHSLGGKVIGRIPEDTSQLLLHNPIQVCNVLVRREWIDQVGFFDESLHACEDWDLWLRLAKAGCRMLSVEHTVSLYRIHHSQMTREVDRMRNATFAVLDKNYSDPSLPESWKALRDKAYSRAHLRTAGSASRTGAFHIAMKYLSESLRLDPELLLNGARPLIRRFTVWTNDPRVINKLEYLDSLYENLPKNLKMVKHRKHRDLAQAAMRIAYQAHDHGDRDIACQAVFQAFCHDPRWLFNRGAVSIFIRSWLNPSLVKRK